MGQPSAIIPYLIFSGRCDEAIEFYKSAIDAEVGMLMRFNESPDPIPEGMIAPGFEDKVMHASLHICGAEIYLSDGMNTEQKFSGFTLSLTVPSPEVADKYFAALAAGGQVYMPLGKTFWSPYFGMVEDKFGLGWMITIPD